MTGRPELTELVRLTFACGAAACLVVAFTAVPPFEAVGASFLGTMLAVLNLLWFGVVGDVLLFAERRTTMNIMLAVLKPFGIVLVVVLAVTTASTVMLPFLAGLFSFVPAAAILGIILWKRLP